MQFQRKALFDLADFFTDIRHYLNLQNHQTNWKVGPNLPVSNIEESAHVLQSGDRMRGVFLKEKRETFTDKTIKISKELPSPNMYQRNKDNIDPKTLREKIEPKIIGNYLK